MKIKLGELADIMTGNTPSMKVNEYYDSNDIPFIKPDSFKSHFELKANSYISNKAERKARIVGANCILVSCIGIIGKVGITSQKVAFNQQINSLNVKPHYDIEYIAYILLFNKERLQRICNSAVVPLINKTQFSNFEISINKDIIIQRDIKNKLNLLSSIINNNKKKLLLLDDIVKSRFVEMFGELNHNPLYPIVSFKDLIIGSPMNGFFASKELYDNNGKVNLVGVKEVVGQLYTKISGTPKLDTDASVLEKYLIKYGDMLFCRSSLVQSGIAKASVVPKLNNKLCIFECHIIKVKLDQERCIPEFMQVQSEQNYFRNQVIKNSKTSTMTTISQQGIVDTKVLLPPIAIQLEFTTFLSQINKLKFA